MDFTETGRGRHPCVSITPDDVERARRNVERYAWARSLADDTIAAAGRALDRSPEWIHAHCPEGGAAFAYGFTGCPICSARWGAWGAADCSFSRPGTVRCANGHVLPDADHPDEGSGYVAPDGRVHYFVGSYNAWVVETYQAWCRHLSLAYCLTGDEACAARCAVILDALAEIYPTCDKGSWDYPSDPPSGRLCRPWYQVARVLVTLVDFYDRVYHSPSLDEPSRVKGLTRRQNIEDNLLKNGARYCYEQSLEGGMHNGEADYIRGALAVGCLLGIQGYVDWAVDGPYGIRAMVNNNADRDGRYIETSLSYALHCRDLYLTFAEPLYNYRSAGCPNGLNLYDDVTFRSFFILPSGSMDCVGHWPRYGDSAPDTKRSFTPEDEFAGVDARYAERIHARASDPQVRSSFAELVRALTDDVVDAARTSSADREWLLFHAEPLPGGSGALPAHLGRLGSDSILLGQKGIGILRTPPGDGAQAVLLRYGPTLNHGHYDDLNINYVALGYELTYDLGYGNGSTHTQVGWAKQTAAHQLVVVNEARQQSDSSRDDTGGSLYGFASMPGLRLIDAEAAATYASQGVTRYRRTVALVGDGEGGYLLDVFRVDGGRQHDYAAHALSAEVTFDGVSMGEQEPGSLAGADVDWGERQQNDGFLSGVPQTPYWVAPPENGYGFLVRPSRGRTDGTWSATWTLPDGETRLRLTALGEPDTEVISAWAPGITAAHPGAQHVIARRVAADAPLSSTFVTVREPFAGKGGRIVRIRRLEAAGDACGIAVEASDGTTDRYLHTTEDAGAAAEGLALTGVFGHVREESGQVTEAHVVAGSVRAPGFSLDLAAASHRGSVVRVDTERNRVYVDADLPDDGRLDFQIVRFGNPGYGRNTAYTIHRIFRRDGVSVIDLGPQRIVLGQGVLQEDPVSATEMRTPTQHDFARGLTRRGTNFFQGKALVSADGRVRTVVTSARYARPFELTVASTEGFRSGDTFYYLDLQAGDTFAIDNWACVRIGANGDPSVRATDAVSLTLDGRTWEVPWSR